VIQEAGNELAGHTVSHADLPMLDVDEQRRQVCDDRDVNRPRNVA
jgi:hypothetical protein